MLELLSAVFPLLSILGGGYLFYRGIRRKLGTGESLSGRITCADPLESRISGRKCAYSKITVFFYQRGPSPWKEVYSFESRVPFRIEGKPVNPAHAAFFVESPKTYEGYIRPSPGLFDQIGPGIRQLRGIADVTSEISPNEVLDEAVLRALLGLPGAKEKLKNHLKGALRVVESMVPEGTYVTVMRDPAAPPGKPGEIAGTLDYPLAISDSAGGRAASVMDEKALLSIILGGFLICLGAAALLLMVF
jgi:hypothetical protein